MSDAITLVAASLVAASNMEAARLARRSTMPDQAEMAQRVVSLARLIAVEIGQTEP